MKKFYVYIHYNKVTGLPFYIGKGHGERAHYKYTRNPKWTNIVNKYDYTVDFLEVDLTEEESLELEVYWIAQFKAWGFSLANMTDGGDGQSKGYKPSAETIAKMKGKTPWNKGKKIDKPSPKKGVAMTDEQREKISKSKLGKPSPNKGRIYGPRK